MPADKTLRFGDFRLDPGRLSLAGPTGERALRPKAFDVLLYLVRHRDRVVSKDELMQAVWPNVFVTENSLVQCISDIRAALGEGGADIVKTVARRGYRFAAPVSDEEPPPTVSPEPGPLQAVSAPRQRLPFVVACISIALFLAVTGGGWWWMSRYDVASREALATAQNRLSIAVLPLTAVDGSVDSYLADGLGEDIISALARFADLKVLSPATVAAYKGRTPTREEVARDLGVRYLADGSLRRVGSRLRIAMRLSDAHDGTLVWAEQYNVEADQLIAVEGDILRAITGALAMRVTSLEQARIAARPPASLEAYDLVLRGRDLLSRLTRSATSNARLAFERAIELDPNYGPAYVGLGRADFLAVTVGWTSDPAGTLRRAETRAREAIALDEFNPAAYTLLGTVHTRLGEYDRAIEMLRHALSLNPNNPDTHAGLGDALLWNGEIDEALRALEIANQLNPRLPSHDLFNLGAAYFLAGQTGQAAKVFERTVARQDGNPFIYAMLAAIYVDAGRAEDARRAAAEARRQNPLFDLDSFGTLFRNPAHRDRIIAALHRAGF